MGEAEEKKKRLEEAEMKRQAMMQAQKEKQQAAGGKGGGAKMQQGAAVQDARREMTKTKEQLEEEKKISLSIRIKPLDLTPWTQTSSPAKPKNSGTPLSGLKPKSTILRKDKRGRTMTLKSSRKDRNNN